LQPRSAEGFVRARIAAKGKVPAGTLEAAIKTIFAGRASPPAERDEDIAWFLGHEEPASIEVDETFNVRLAKTSDARLPLMLLAVAAAVAEDNLADYEVH